MSLSSNINKKTLEKETIILKHKQYAFHFMKYLNNVTRIFPNIDEKSNKRHNKTSVAAKMGLFRTAIYGWMKTAPAIMLVTRKNAGKFGN